MNALSELSKGDQFVVILILVLIWAAISLVAYGIYYGAKKTKGSSWSSGDSLWFWLVVCGDANTC